MDKQSIEQKIERKQELIDMYTVDGRLEEVDRLSTDVESLLEQLKEL